MLFLFFISVFGGTGSIERALAVAEVAVLRTGPVSSAISGMRRYREVKRGQEFVREFWDQSFYMKEIHYEGRLRLAEVSFTVDTDIVKSVIRFSGGRSTLLSLERIRNPVFCYNNCGQQVGVAEAVRELHSLLRGEVRTALMESRLFSSPSCQPPRISSEAQSDIAAAFAKLVSSSKGKDDLIGCVQNKLGESELANEMKVSLTRLMGGHGLQMNCDPVPEGAKFDGASGVLHFGPPFDVYMFFHELLHVPSGRPKGEVRSEQYIDSVVRCCSGAKAESSCGAAREGGGKYELPKYFQGYTAVSKFFGRAPKTDSLMLELEHIRKADIVWKAETLRVNPCYDAEEPSEECVARVNTAYNAFLKEQIKLLCEMPEGKSVERCLALPDDYPARFTKPTNFASISGASLDQADRDRMNQISARLPQMETVQQIPASLKREIATRQASAVVAALGGRTYAPESAVGQWFDDTVTDGLDRAARWGSALVLIERAHAAEPSPPTKPNTPTLTATVFSVGEARSATPVHLPPTKRHLGAIDRVRGGKPVVANPSYFGVKSVDIAPIDVGASKSRLKESDPLGKTPDVALGELATSATVTQPKAAASATIDRKEVTPRSRGPGTSEHFTGEFGNGALPGRQSSQDGMGTEGVAANLPFAIASGKSASSRPVRDRSATNSAAGKASYLPQIVSRYLARRGTTVKGSIESRDRDFEALLRDNGLQFIAGDLKVGAQENVKERYLVDQSGNVTRQREEVGP